ncbi:coagulation factor V [Tachyglossus aculeatus]|uniref:coagulation factor V n=1 Tax=Tachyglossus aculeatus TaxID=9261 RepID=UPI0018F54E24|nr:coagulation factor V [Tachyglossus aculeatus]
MAWGWPGLWVLVVLCSSWPLGQQHGTEAAGIRDYYIAAQAIDWTYRPPQPEDLRSEDSGLVFKKIVYREYFADFYKEKPRSDISGLLGPTILAEVGDILNIHFKNLVNKPLSIHPQGIAYGKLSEGASYADRTAPFEKMDDAVLPGQQFTYVWKITEDVGPTEADPPCLTQIYYSHENVILDFNSGLVGALLICKKGSLTEEKTQILFDKQQVLMFAVFDESKSWKPTPSLMYTVNGYVNGTLPDIQACTQDHISWHLIGMSSGPELFSVHFSGQVLEHQGHKLSTFNLVGSTAFTANMTVSHEGRWMISSLIPTHMEAGMGGYLRVKLCNKPNNGPKKISHSERRQMRKRTYFIAAEEVMWNYAPMNKKQLDQNYTSQRFDNISSQTGKIYKKVVYKQYQDASFTKHLENSKPQGSGILGPIIRAQIRDTIQIVFKNLASRPYSIYPHGVSLSKSEEAASYPVEASGNGTLNRAVQPGEIYTYQWNILESDEPSEKDAQCVTRPYYSAVDVTRDIASGLIGLLLICKSRSLNEQGGQIKVDLEQQAVFAVFDENKSWYIKDNIDKLSQDPASIKRDDPRFYESNVMSTINGFVPESLPVLGFCFDDVIQWNFCSIGSWNTIVTVHFTGHSFWYEGRPEDVLTLFPMSEKSVTVPMDNVGIWMLSSMGSNEGNRSVGLRFRVVKCIRNEKDEAVEFTLKKTDGGKPSKPENKGENEGQNGDDLDYQDELASNYGFDFVKMNLLQEEGNELLGIRAQKNSSRSPETSPGFDQSSPHNGRSSLADGLSEPQTSSLHLAFPTARNLPQGLPGAGGHSIVERSLAGNSVLPSDHQEGTPALEVKEVGLFPDGEAMRQENIEEKGGQAGTEMSRVSNNMTLEEEGGNESERHCLPQLEITSASSSEGVTSEDSLFRSGVPPSSGLGAKGHPPHHLILSKWKNPTKKPVENWDLGSEKEGSKTIERTDEGGSFDKLPNSPQYASNKPSKPSDHPELQGSKPKIKYEEERDGGTSQLRPPVALIRTRKQNSSKPAPHSAISPKDFTAQQEHGFDDTFLQPGLNHPPSLNESALPSPSLDIHLTSPSPQMDQRQPLPFSELIFQPEALDQLSPLLDLIQTSQPQEFNQTMPPIIRMNETPSTVSSGLTNTPMPRQLKTEIAVSWSKSDGDYSKRVGRQETKGNNEALADDDHSDPYQNDSRRNKESFPLSNLFFHGNHGNQRYYYIAAEEVLWNYSVFQESGETLGHSGNLTEPPVYRKVIFRSYLDSTFTTPDLRGEYEEHLGILGPVIRAEVDDVIKVHFKNLASRPYSLHAHGLSYDKLSEGKSYEDEMPEWFKKDDAVQPNNSHIYIWFAKEKSGPETNESACRIWPYYSAVNPEKDIHSGLIGPILVCHRGTLRKQSTQPPDTREFVLLFMIFDEEKSWYSDHRTGTAKSSEDPKPHRFHAINGFVTYLPGLRMYQDELVHWHLLNMGSSQDLHVIHFHGQTLLEGGTQAHRLGVYPLLPGSFQTLQMKAAQPGFWLLESEVGESQKERMRAIFHIINKDCKRPMGLSTGTILDSQISASGHHSNWEPKLARLNKSGFYNAWSTEKSTLSPPWIQIDLQREVVLTGIQTQGAKHYLKSYFTTQFYLTYSTDKRRWNTFKGKSTLKQQSFDGNSDASTIKENKIDPPIVAKYVRIYPTLYYRRPTLRLELQGCEVLGCYTPLGKESKEIAKAQITASSFRTSWWGTAWEPSFARLNEQGQVNAWQAESSDNNQWLQINLLQTKKITAIATQGAKSLNSEMFVETYSVLYSDQGSHWKPYTENLSSVPKILPGNINTNGLAVNYFNPPIFSRFIRIIPKTWNTRIALRIELYGCDIY